jgi:hypothetical protein
MNDNLEDKIIETDLDTSLEDQNDGGIYPYDPAYENIEIGEFPFSVFEYLRQLAKDKITIQPDFQRNQVWTNKQKSKFIESIILNFPLPPIYLNETRDSTFIVIDGLQRSTALKEFYKDEFAINGIEALPMYNGRRYSTLPEIIKSKFEDKKLTVFILKPSTPMVVIYDLFNRINTGGTQLNKQEVRNCIFIGKSTQLLRELSEQDYFKKAISSGVSPKRMKDREVILRYLSFRWFDYQSDYKGDMSDFIEKVMKTINQKDDSFILDMKEDFQRVMNMSYLIWGVNNFRIATEFSRGTINIAILETVCNYLSSKSDIFLKQNIEVLRRNYLILISNKIYLEAVTNSTSNKIKVFERFKIVHEILNIDTK